MKFPAILMSTLFAVAASASAEQATPIGQVERGTMVTLAGEVQRIMDTDEFLLKDDSGSIRVYVGSTWVPAPVGEAVTVSGFVDNDLGRLELYARTLVRADGTLVEFDHRYD